VLELDFDDEGYAEPDRYLGMFEGMPETMYRRAPGMNKSGMDTFMRSPLHYLTMKKDPPPPTPQMFVGSALHTLVLEPERFDQEYIPDKFPGSKARAAEEWRAAQRLEGKKILSTASNGTIWDPSDWDMIHHMRDSVMAHPIASILLEGKREISVFWIDKKMEYHPEPPHLPCNHPGTGKLCKGRIDVYNDGHNALIDLKSGIDASFSGTQRAVHRYHYNIQDAIYSDGWRAAASKPADYFIFIFIEKLPPYGVGCYDLPPAWRQDGRLVYQRTLIRFAECHEKDDWPCYPTEVRTLDMPGYAKYHDIF